ncbi:MAG: relaxase domain-containing protein [Acidimicrobiales bacterium]|nr:relaxase domain-containing protein [Acidimicrobiales bacterium]
MTARTTTLKGGDAGAYYVEKELGYYLDRGEPQGRWQGRGAPSLELGDTVDEESFLSLMAGEDPRTGRLLGTRHTDKTDRGFDVTCSAPKGVSVLFALGNGEVRREVLEAHDTAVAAMIEWVERHAHTRYRVNGQIRTFDAEGILVANFRHHTSRALDPQVHTHSVVVNRVMSPDGRWLALDARTIKKDQQTLSRLYHSGLRAEMTRRLGVRWVEPSNGIAEIADIPTDVLREFSQRTEAIDRRIDEKIDRFEDVNDREPTLRERWRLEREAVLDTRPHKEDDTDPIALEENWRDRLLGLGLTPDKLVADATGHERGLDRVDDATRARIAKQALDAMVDQQSTWRSAEVVREVAAAVPTTVVLPADELARWVDGLSDEIVRTHMIDLSWPAPEEVPRRRDGRPITESAVDRVLTTPDILAQEERLQRLAEKRFGAGGVDHQIEAIEGLTPAQAQLATAVAGDRQLVLAVGPAGTGKTTALRPGIEQLRREGRAVFGVAPSAAAAEVLAVDTGVDADTLDKLLIEHCLKRPPDHRYDLPAGSTVVVDESGMVSTPKLAELFDLAEEQDWRLVLVGDPMQFSAVGRSGMFGHLVDSFGTIELDRVHRFNHPWEAKASLRLRRGDTAVVDEYEEHGRLRGGTATRMRVAAVGAWWRAIERGETACLMAPTNAAVVELNHSAQWRRLDAGQLDHDGPTLEVGPYRLHIGDRVATRHNDRRLRTNRQLMVKNRDRWTVDAIHRDGSVTVTGRSGEIRLPAEYVAEHVELAYAETSHASQGRTVDRSILFLDGPTGAAGIYVPMTRGRESNEVFVAIRGEETPADVVSEALARTWIDRPAIAVRDELTPSVVDDNHEGALARAMPAHELRRVVESVVEAQFEIQRIESSRTSARHAHAEAVSGLKSAEQRLRQMESRLQQARSDSDQFDHPLIRRLHRREVDGARAQLRWLPKAVEQTRTEIAELNRAVARPEGSSLVARLDRGKELSSRRSWRTFGRSSTSTFSRAVLPSSTPFPSQSGIVSDRRHRWERPGKSGSSPPAGCCSTRRHGIST